VLQSLGPDQSVEHEVSENDFVVMAPGCDHPRPSVDAAAAADRLDWIAHRQANPDETGSDLRLEACMAGRVHATLRDVPVAALGDMGYWRYLALFPYRWYLLAREPELQPQDYGGTSPHPTDPEKSRGTGPKYQLLLRTFLWGKASFDPTAAADPYRRATLVGDTGGAEIDVWHSHIVRTQLGHLGAVPRHFIDSICADPKANDRDAARDVEKALTRMKHNVVFDVYQDDARVLVDEQKASVLATRSALTT
jgi:hypothetical protein